MMKKIIGVLTATRAEFGLLKPLIKRLLKEKFCDTKVLVTGAHLSPAFGNTYKEIEMEGIPIAEKIECIMEGDTPRDISNSMAVAVAGFAEYFEKNELNLLIVLGDRYETMAVCVAAMNEEIPIAHIHGGESTVGVVDEAIRHSVTKMSQLHFTSTNVYRNRVIQLGEQPDRVFNVGSLAVENIKSMNFLSRKDLEKELGIGLKDKFGVVTFHPVTLEEDNGAGQFEQLIAALDEFPEMSFVMTKANADAGGRNINDRIDEYVRTRSNVIVVASLGARRYLSAIKECAVVIGNSSSGIYEAPCLFAPTVNIGDRQKGRLIPKSVLCCEPVKGDIVHAIRIAVGDEFREEIRDMATPFGNGEASGKIVEILRSIFEKEGTIKVSKTFFDIDKCNIEG